MWQTSHVILSNVYGKRHIDASSHQYLNLFLMKALIFVMLLAVVPLHAQQPAKPIAGSERFAITVKNKKGFIDRQVVIQSRFEAVQEFKEGLCAVRLNGVYGFIDEQGTVVIPPAYDYATEFSEGLALVYLDGKPLFIIPESRYFILPIRNLKGA